MCAGVLDTLQCLNIHKLYMGFKPQMVCTVLNQHIHRSTHVADRTSQEVAANLSAWH